MSVRMRNKSYLKPYNEGNNNSPSNFKLISIEPIEPGHWLKRREGAALGGAARESGQVVYTNQNRSMARADV